MSVQTTAHNESAELAHDESAIYPIEITVYGEPEPAGSKSSFVPTNRKTKKPFYKNGRIVVNTVDANPKAKGWKSTVKASAGIQYLGPMLRGPLAVEFIFYRKRNKGDFGTGRNEGIVKDSADAYPTKRPDALKLARAVEDALTDVLWLDDAQIVDEHIGKRFGDRARVEIKIWPVAAQTVLDLVSSGEIEPPKPSEQFEQLSLVA